MAAMALPPAAFSRLHGRSSLEAMWVTSGSKKRSQKVEKTFGKVESSFPHRKALCCLGMKAMNVVVSDNNNFRSPNVICGNR